jgi:hypothetical protein
MKVNFKVRGIEELQKFLESLPRGAVRIALKAFTEYVIGDENHGLKHPDPYKFVTRKSAYGFSFFTDKQRRWFFANLNDDESNELKIGDNRTGTSEDAWQFVMVSDWNIRITNPEPGAYFTRDDSGQARQPEKVGWRKTTKVIMDNFAGGVRAANTAINEWLKGKI